ncbi:hypothetical protein D9M68_473800 [compost metagenome]
MVGSTGQQLVPAGQEVAVIEAMQQAAQHVEFFLQHRIGFMGVDGGPPPAFAGGVFLERRLQFVGNADVIHHQATLLVLEHPIDPGDGLHQVVALHRLVDIQGMHARRIEAGQPHVADDHQLQRIGRILETLLQALLHLAGVNMRAQQCLVRGTAGHDDLHRALLRIIVVPFGAQGDDLVIQVHADLATHGHHHGLAALRLVALLEVRDQIGRHALDTRLGPHDFFQRGPARLQARLLILFLILGQLVDLVVDMRQLRVFERQLGQPRLVVDGHGGAIFLGLLHVVDVDVVAEHRPGVAVFAGHRRAGKGHEGSVGQSVA